MNFRRPVQELGLSFLDVICCGFGAIILLLMITKISLPMVLETSIEDVAAQVALKQDALDKLLGDSAILQRTKVETEADLDKELESLSILQDELLELTSKFKGLQEITDEQREEIIKLSRAKQSLTDEMERLLGSNYTRRGRNIGGLTVDSEYIIFVIDTSGSMQQYAWPTVVQKLTEVLNVHPEVKGIQVLNDMGRYMFPNTRGQWVEDTQARRDAILTKLRSWALYSNSSPVEGIEEAIRTYYDPNKQVSIYVFGDDFSARTVEPVIDRIDAINSVDGENQCRVRIHAVGFPVYFDAGRASPGVTRFALLMRELAARNCGTFVALPTLYRS